MKTIPQLIKELNFYDFINKARVLFQRMQDSIEDIDLSSKQDVLTEENVGEFMDLELPTKVTPGLNDALLARDLITNNAVEVTIGSIVQQLVNVGTGFESVYTTTDQSITLATDTVINFSGSEVYSNGGIDLINVSNNEITPITSGDVISIDVAMPFTTPAGSGHFCHLYLRVKGTSEIYRAITHSYLRGSGNIDYISSSWTVPVNPTAVTNKFELVINSDTNIVIDREYISVTRVHKSK